MPVGLPGLWLQHSVVTTAARRNGTGSDATTNDWALGVGGGRSPTVRTYKSTVCDGPTFPARSCVIQGHKRQAHINAMSWLGCLRSSARVSMYGPVRLEADTQGGGSRFVPGISRQNAQKTMAEAGNRPRPVQSRVRQPLS